jgi:hypothetical protein
VSLLVLWVVAALAVEPDPLAEPTDQTLIYYNARMALREEQPIEAVKLWLLRNAVEVREGVVSSHDDDFGSVAWAAMGQLGLCQDGQPTDEDGAGLWPLALHNWLVKDMGRRVPKGPRPFDAFEVGQQQRRVSINDVLSADELRAVQFKRGHCLRPRLLLALRGENPLADLSDPPVVAGLLLELLDRSASTLDPAEVRGLAVLESRKFDLHLQLIEFAAREAKRDARKRARRARTLGLSRTSVAVMNEDAPTHSFADDSVPAAILRESSSWPASEWMALSPDRRLFLFDQARDAGGDPKALDGVVLGILDALVTEGEGEQVAAWVARHSGAHDDPAAREAIWGGELGQRLLALDPESGFQERSVIALYRGVDQLERGELRDALRSLAFALQQSEDSRDAETTRRLSRRWLAYTAAQFESTSELLITLRELIPARDYSLILEDLMWHAALRADRDSFERGLAARSSRSGGRAALDRRFALLQPLAGGDLATFIGTIRAGLTESPSETLRFLDQLVEQLELESSEVRVAHLPTFERVSVVLTPLTVAPTDGSPVRQTRTALALLERIQAIQEGQQGVGPNASHQERARALSPTGEIFAGSVRLAPADPLPWPFVAVDVPAPSVFTPIELTPREWRDGSGAWVFGWSLRG